MDPLSNINNTHVTVIDQRMGSGKSTWAIQYIDSLPDDKHVLYITPYTAEIDRIISACTNKQVVQPDYSTGNHTKLASLHDQIENDKDIASTHALFSHFTDETARLLTEHEYILILDEVIEPVNPVSMKSSEFNSFLASGRISINEETKAVSWDDTNGGSETDYKEIRDHALKGELYYIERSNFVWCYPPQVFKAFTAIYLLTYLFDGSCMKSYFGMNGIQYEKKCLSRDSNGIYSLTEYYEDNTSDIRDLINIYEDDTSKLGKSGRLNTNFVDVMSKSYKQTILSATWYKSKGKDIPTAKAKIAKNTYNYLRRYCNAPVQSALITVFKSSESDVYFDGTEWHKPTNSKYALYIRDYDSQIVPFNTRSTNDYRDTYNIAYLVNRYIHPDVRKFFSLKGYPVDGETWALAEMIQLIWRSRIRNQFDEQGQPVPDDQRQIYIYIPSERMRRLLKRYLQKS